MSPSSVPAHIVPARTGDGASGYTTPGWVARATSDSAYFPTLGGTLVDAGRAVGPTPASAPRAGPADAESRPGWPRVTNDGCRVRSGEICVQLRPPVVVFQTVFDA